MNWIIRYFFRKILKNLVTVFMFFLVKLVKNYFKKK